MTTPTPDLAELRRLAEAADDRRRDQRRAQGGAAMTATLCPVCGGLDLGHRNACPNGGVR